MRTGWPSGWCSDPWRSEGSDRCAGRRLFLKRQPEVSEEYAAFFASKILTGDNLADAVLRGPASDDVFALVERAVEGAIDEAAGSARPFVQLAVGTREWIDMKHAVCGRLVDEVPGAVARAHGYMEEALDLEAELRTNLQALPSKDFEQVLRPIFQEDERLLIAVGAALGGAAGCLQTILFG